MFLQDLLFSLISIPYIFLFVLTFLWYKRQNDLIPFQINTFIITLISISILLVIIVTNIDKFYFGYAYEYFAFMKRAMGDAYLPSLISASMVVLILALTCMNLKKSIRANNNYQVLIFLLHVMVIIFSTTEGLNQNVNVIPGWHTTIFPDPFPKTHFVIILTWLIIIFFGRRYKLNSINLKDK